MNQPQPGRGSEIMTEAANWIRSSFVADPGFILAELDWKAIEALLVGYFAGDQDYMEAARKGVHDIFASHLLVRAGLLEKPKTPYDPDLPEYVAWLKANHEQGFRYKAKKRIHAGAYGQGPYNMARDLGCTVAEVRELDKAFEAMAPKVVRWQLETRLRAHKEGRLTNPFGFSNTYFHVFEKDGSLGREASECLAFLPQSTGAAMLRECLVDLGTHPEEGEMFQILYPEHDSLKLQIRLGEEKRIMDLVRGSMERNWLQLGGLSVAVDAKVGLSMDKMEKWKWN